MPSCQLRVRVTPRSSRSKVECTSDGIKVWVTAAPTDGQANEAVCKVLAKTLGVAPSAVTVVRGQASREKLIEVMGLSTEDAEARLRSDRD